MTAGVLHPPRLLKPGARLDVSVVRNSHVGDQLGPQHPGKNKIHVRIISVKASALTTLAKTRYM